MHRHTEGRLAITYQLVQHQLPLRWVWLVDLEWAWPVEWVWSLLAHQPLP